MKTIIIASNNTHKASEIKQILQLDDCEILTLREAGIEINPKENLNSYLGNARIKALAAEDAAEDAAKRVIRGIDDDGHQDFPDKKWAYSDAIYVLADDSGLEVDALIGAPGVHSARYAGENATDAQNNEKLLDALRNVEPEHRGAHFVCQLVMLRCVRDSNDEGQEILGRGVMDGRIALKEHGRGGFGYDPLFLPWAIDYKRSAAQLTPEEKNAISHRSAALRDLRYELIKRGW